MEKDALKLFLNKKVKLVQEPRFVLFGKIIDIFDDCIVFETEQATSLISLSFIREVTLERENEDD